MLEPRQLLAADLGVTFDQGALDFPSIVVPGDNVVPDSAFDAPIRIVNNGPQAAIGLVNIAFYLSTDTVLNTSTDLLMREYRSEPLELPVFTGNPNEIGEFSPDMRVPAETQPGTYHIIVRITYPNSQIDDFNNANNIAVSDDTFQVQRRFGAVGGRSNITMVLKDADDTLVAFSLSGGGSGTVTTDSNGRFTITTTGTGTASDISLQTSGGDGIAELSLVTINGAARSFVAPAARLVGAFSPTSSLVTLTLGDVNSASTITLPSTTVATAVTLGDVANASISAPGGLTSLTVKSWNDDDSTVDIIQSKFITTLRTLGTGNFNASLRLSNNGAAGTLGSAIIGGVIRGGSWVIIGQVGSISAFATAVAWTATTPNSIASLTITNTLRGVVTAKTFGTVSAGRDILARSSQPGSGAFPAPASTNRSNSSAASTPASASSASAMSPDRPPASSPIATLVQPLSAGKRSTCAPTRASRSLPSRLWPPPRA
jgi:hypothetical protein